MRKIKQGACPSPNCSSSDAYTEYQDGHGYCFSCHYYKSAKIQSLEQVSNILLNKSQDKSCTLPNDFTLDIPKEPLTWLKKYGLLDKEIQQANLGWSTAYKMLIFPFINENKTLLAWQGRFFPKQKPKCVTFGDMSLVLPVVQAPPKTKIKVDSIVIVEDVVSSLKVGRYVDTMALIGSNVDLNKLITLSYKYKHLYIWLDSDKMRSAHAFKTRYKVLFDNVFIVFTEKDPKELSNHQILEALGNAI